MFVHRAGEGIAGLSLAVPLDADAVNAAFDSLESFSNNTVRTVNIP